MLLSFLSLPVIPKLKLTEAGLVDVEKFAVVDVAFISLTNILPAVNEVLRSGSSLVTLIKPQFEAGREQVGKGGVVRDPEIRRQVVEKIHTFGVEALSLEWLGSCESPIHGPAGNLEFLAWWKKT